MKLRIRAPLAIAAFTSYVLVSTQTLAQNAYITNQNEGSDSVSVIDTTTNTVIATIPVGLFPTGVAVTPDASRVYITNQDSDSVSVIDTGKNTVIAVIPVGIQPIGVAVTPDGGRAYVANLRIDNMSVTDTAKNVVIATIAVPIAAGPLRGSGNPGRQQGLCHGYRCKCGVGHSYRDKYCHRRNPPWRLWGARRCGSDTGQQQGLCREFLRQYGGGDRHSDE